MMNDTTEIIERAMGKLQIFIKPKDKIKSESLMERLRPKQVYRELVKNAKADGLMNASVYQTLSGFSADDKIRVAHPELDNLDLAMCVELIDEKPKLEEFCKNNAALLKGRMIVYKAVEFWDIK